MRLDKKVILITASTRGIGLACVQKCASEGGIVYMAARNEKTAKERADELNAQGYQVHVVYHDAGIPESYKTMVEDVIKKEGRIDVLVNNFGTSDPTKDLTIETTSYDYFKSNIEDNLSSVFLSCQAVIPHMIQTGGGSIVNISSIAGLIPDLSRIAYSTSKSAIIYLTKTIAVQEARNNIRCNAVLPGMTETDSVKDSLTEEFKHFFLRHTPIQRMARPEEIASAVSYFASDEASFTTGQILAVSGGFGLATPVYGDMMDPHEI